MTWKAFMAVFWAVGATLWMTAAVDCSALHHNYVLADIELLGTSHRESPYALEEQRDLNSLIEAHQAYQTQVLTGSNSSATTSAQAFVVVAPEGAGVGNRLPSIITGYLIALFTQRVLLIDAKTVLDHIQLPFPGDWHQHKSAFLSDGEACIPLAKPAAAAYGELQYCGISYNITSNDSDASVGFCTGTLQDAPVLKYMSTDYDMPLLQINAQFAPLFAKFFPHGEIFHPLAASLFKPAPVMVQALQHEQAGNCSVGIQMRHKKPYSDEALQAEQFAGIARMLHRQIPGTVHLATDSDIFDRMAALVGPQLRWSNLTRSSLGVRTSAHNPGTELSAFVDIFMLAGCKAVVVTPGSSFGWVAAAIGGVKPVYATYGKHDVPFVNPWFWQSITSEPCMFKAGRSMHNGGPMASRLKRDYPLYMVQTQCHW